MTIVANLRQDPPADALALRGEAPTLFVREPEPPPIELLLEDEVLLDEVLQDLLLPAVEQACEREHQESQGKDLGRHQAIVPATTLRAAVTSGSAEFSHPSRITWSQ